MSKSLTDRFRLAQSDISKSLKFAQTAVDGKSQSLKDFGSAIIRERNDQIADIAEGKMAEICFKMFLKENFNLDIKLDFSHYPGHHEIDFGNDIEELDCGCGDLKMSTYRVDVKSTRMYSKWLLVESHKFWSNAYCLVKINLPRNHESNPFSATGGGIEAEIAGFAYYSDFIDPLTKKPWFGYSQNDRLLNPDDIDFGTPSQPVDIKELSRNPKIKKLGEPLKSNKNYAIPIRMLRKEPKDWEKLIHFIKSSLIDRTDQIILTQKANKKNFSATK